MAITFSNVPEDVALYGRMNVDTVDYIRSQMHEGMQRFSSRALERYEHLRDDVLRTVSVGAMSRKLEAATRITRSKFRSDSIRRLSDIGDFQNAPDQMLNYLAANPSARRRIHSNQCDGWSDRYVDDQPDAIGEDHYWYRRSTQGVYLPNEDNTHLVANVYFEKLREGDSELEFERQQDILESWNMLNAFLEVGRDDPTSKWNAQLN